MCGQLYGDSLDLATKADDGGGKKGGGDGPGKRGDADDGGGGTKAGDGGGGKKGADGDGGGKGGGPGRVDPEAEIAARAGMDPKTIDYLKDFTDGDPERHALATTPSA